MSAEELIRSHLPLVHHLVRDLLGRIPSHVRRDELVSAGMLALVTSAKSFDPSRGVIFARYAAIRIRGALTDELRSMDWASRTVRAKAREMDTVDQPAGRRRPPADAGRDRRRHGRLGRRRSTASPPTSAAPRPSACRPCRATVPTGSPTPGANPESIVLGREQLGHLRDAVAELPERLRHVIECYFYDQRTMADIAAELGVTESRVSQIRIGGAGADARRDALDRRQRSPPAARPRMRPGAARRSGQAYVAAVATRSTLSSRLEATSVFDSRWPSS